MDFRKIRSPQPDLSVFLVLTDMPELSCCENIDLRPVCFNVAPNPQD